MPYRKWVTSLVMVLSLPAFGTAGVPYVPPTDDTVLEQVTRAGPGSDEFRRMQRELGTHPNDLRAALDFARASIKIGNEESDPRYFGYAQSALAPWWHSPSIPPNARLLRATILQWQHQFEPAKQDLAAIITADSADVNQAHLTRATIELVQGDPAAARHDCVALIGHVETLIVATCIASANSLNGRAAAMEKALSDAVAQSRDASAEAQLWAWTELADIALRLDHRPLAQTGFDQALAAMDRTGRRDPYLLAAYADFLLDAHRFGDAVALLTHLSRIDNLLLRLTLAEQGLGEQGDASMRAQATMHADDLLRRFEETRQRGDSVHQREEAMYLLKVRKQPAQALDVAEDNWHRQRELIDAQVLLESARAAGKPDAAREVTDWIRRWGVEDVRLQGHRP